MKIITRIAMLYIILGHIIAFNIAPYSSKELEIFQTKDWLLFIWGSFYLISIFFMWGYFFHHWGISEFEKNNVKRIWFWVIFLGGILYFIGPFVYYIVVYERSRGLKRKE